jgi:hypothetical protein
MRYTKPEITSSASAVEVIEITTTKPDCTRPDVDVRPISVNAYEADE